MNDQSNRTNILSQCYRSLDKNNRRIFRKKMMELCNIAGDQTIFRKLRPEYEPAPIEAMAAKMIVDELTIKQ